MTNLAFRIPVIEALKADGPLRTLEIIERIGGGRDPTEVSRQLNEMVISGLVKRGPKVRTLRETGPALVVTWEWTGKEVPEQTGGQDAWSRTVIIRPASAPCGIAQQAMANRLPLEAAWSVR